MKGEKLLIGVMASMSAGGAGYYATPETIRDFKDWINENDDGDHTLKGFMIWDSNWDKLNSFLISTACAA